MNKAAFLSLIQHLKENFTPEKIEIYVNQLEELKNNGNLELIAQNLQAQNMMEYDYDPEFKQKLNNNEFLIQKHKEEVEHAIQNLKWIGELTGKLTGQREEIGLEKGMAIIRDHFSEVYKKAYKVHLMSEEDKANAIERDKRICYFLAPGVVGGPNFDDQTIYRFFNEMNQAISTNCAEVKSPDLIPALNECKNGMATADLGLDHAVTTFVAINDDKEQLKTIINNKDEYDHNKRLAKSILEEEKLHIQVSIPGKIDYNVEEKAAGITKRFFTLMPPKKTSDSRKMRELMNELETYYSMHGDNSEYYRNISGDGNVFLTFRRKVAEIRKEGARRGAKDFHETEIFLQSVDAYSETMYHLCKEQGGAPDRHEESIQKIKQSITKLFERLKKTADGKRSPEFSNMYKALKKLNSRTACNRRELAEQIETARDAAKKYMEAKDGELLHFSKSRFSDKGQARYDAASGIYSMLDAMILPVVQAARDDNTRFLSARKAMILGHENDKKDPSGDFRLSKEYYLHEAKKALLQNEKLADLYNRNLAPQRSIQESGVFLRSYINYMDLVNSSTRRYQMTYDQYQDWCAKDSYHIQSKSAKHTWKYAFIVGQNGADDKSLADGSYVNKEIGVILDAEQIQGLYEAASKQKKILKKIETLSLEDAQKLRNSEKELKKSAEKLAEELGYPVDRKDRLAQEFMKERKEALDQRISALTMVNDNPQKVEIVRGM